MNTAIDNKHRQPIKENSRCQEHVQYTDIFEELGVEYNIRGIWASVGETTLVQGWKLHLSSIPIEAKVLLQKVIPVLLREKLCFKVAKDEWILSCLNEGEFGATQIGKFMTIYPQNDNIANQLANELISITNAFSGPVIVSDMHLGNIVYTRYGGFNSIVNYDRLGQVFLSIYNSKGSLVTDNYSVPFKVPEGVNNPFTNIEIPSICIPESKSTKNSKLFGNRFLILDVIKKHPKGSVFTALDLKSMEDASIKIIKQGRKFCLSDIYGRDMRSRLKRQAYLHNLLSRNINIPSAGDYFEVNGDGYLPIEYIEGQSIETLVQKYMNDNSWCFISVEKQIQLLLFISKTLDNILKIHSIGYVHHDISVSNIWIAKNDEVYLIDLELAHKIDDPTPAYGLGTPGFMSPQQEAREKPAFSDDIYSIGCVMLFVITGIDPRRLLHTNRKINADQIEKLTNASNKLIEIIIECLDINSDLRPSIEKINKVVKQYMEHLANNGLDKKDAIKRNISNNINIPFVLQQGQKGLIEDLPRDINSGLWLSLPISSGKTHGRISRNSFEIYKSANRGIAGIVYILSRLAKFGSVSTIVKEQVQEAVHWLISDNKATDCEMPGLHFGNAGVAVAIAEAVSTQLIEKTPQIENIIEKFLSPTPDWPDITHGAAGQGIATLYCSNMLNNSNILNHAHQYADYLIKNQKSDGSWVVPSGVEGMSGQTISGFAHGVSGMIYFLIEYARVFNHQTAKTSAFRGIEWIIAKSIENKLKDCLEWEYSDSHKEKWKWWCHGSPGIALTFLRLYEHTKIDKYAYIAEKALCIHPNNVRNMNLSQCHGLSGLGEIYLEAGRVLGSKKWFERADNIANVLYQLRKETDTGAFLWLVEDPHIATSDLMCGVSGILHFFLRYSLKGKNIGFPLLLNPIDSNS